MKTENIIEAVINEDALTLKETVASILREKLMTSLSEEKTHFAVKSGKTLWGVGKSEEEAHADAHKEIKKYIATNRRPSGTDTDDDAHKHKQFQKLTKNLKVHPISKRTHDRYKD